MDAKSIADSQNGQDSDFNPARAKADAMEKNYICGCGKTYLNYPALYTHIKTKHDGITPPGTTQPQPETISKSSGRSGSKGRPATGEAGERDYICGCGKAYLNYPALYTHIKTKHDDIAPPATTQPQTSGKSNSRSGSKGRQAEEEAGEKDHICGCGKAYLNYPALYTHIKTKHDGITPPGTTQPQTSSESGRGRPKKGENGGKSEEEEDKESQNDNGDN